MAEETDNAVTLITTATATESGPAPELALREHIHGHFTALFAGSGRIDSWLGSGTPDLVFERLDRVATEPLTRSEFNQLLVLSHEAGMSAAFYEYYWLSTPTHTYDVRHVAPFDEAWLAGSAVQSLDHLAWGLHRFYTDALLYFGNVRAAYRSLRDMDRTELDPLLCLASRQCRGAQRARSRASALQNR